nr:hypothetical protein [Nevskia sp.]
MKLNPEVIIRRDARGLLGAGATIAALPEAAAAKARAPFLATAFRAAHQPKPLRSDPAKLKGLSEKRLRSHWENNYIGSVKTLNTIETRLAGTSQS